MNKVIGAKISDDLYEKINRLGKKSDIVRAALEEYIRNHPELWSNPKVNEGKPVVNRDLNEKEYPYIEMHIDEV